MDDVLIRSNVHSTDLARLGICPGLDDPNVDNYLT